MEKPLSHTTIFMNHSAADVNNALKRQTQLNTEERMRLLARLFPDKLRLTNGKLGLREWEKPDDSDDDIDDEENVNTNIELTHQQTAQWLRLPYALTYYTIQGRTLKDKHIILEDTRSSHFTMRNLIVGMSRATHESLVHIV